MNIEVRGSYNVCSSGNVLMIRWRNNSVVTLGSNFGECRGTHSALVTDGEHKVQVSALKHKVQVSRPTLFTNDLQWRYGMYGFDGSTSVRIS